MDYIHDSCIHPELNQLEYCKTLYSTLQKQFCEIHQRRIIYGMSFTNNIKFV